MLLRPLTQRERMLDELGASDLLAIRRVLRALARDADALATVLTLDKTVVEFAGDDSVIPRAFPRLDRSVPCFSRWRCRDGDEHDVGFVKIRTLWRRPNYGLFVIEPRSMNTGNMFELLESAMEKLEEIVVA